MQTSRRGKSQCTPNPSLLCDGRVETGPEERFAHNAARWRARHDREQGDVTLTCAQHGETSTKETYGTKAVILSCSRISLDDDR